MGHGRDHPSFMLIDSRFAGLYVKRGPGLNLNEAKHIVVPSDQVDLSPAARRAKVPRHHCVAELSQVEVGGFFATASGFVMWSDLLPPQSVFSQPVEQTYYGLRGSAGQLAPDECAWGKH
jgi:hypothetical protein